MISLEHSTFLVYSSSSTLFILFLEKSLIVLGLFQYKYWSEYLLCGRLQWERTAVESLNFLTLWLRLTSRHAGGFDSVDSVISGRYWCWSYDLVAVHRCVCVCLLMCLFVVQAAASWLPGTEVQEQVWQSRGVGERQGRHAEEQGLQELSTEWTQGESRALDSSLNLISTSITNTATSVWTAVSWVRWFPLVYLQKGTLGVYEAGCSSSHPTNSVKAVVETFVCLWKLL